MKTRKLELKDIAGYLPYGLYICNRKDIVRPAWINIYQIENIADNSECKGVILRPLSDLCKTITLNGKEIIPIVELAKIHNKTLKWKLDQQKATSSREEFCYIECERAFMSFYGIFNRTVGSIVKNQYQLFDYLHELKIDYRGLIDDGLAVSVYDLENNPYK